MHIEALAARDIDKYPELIFEYRFISYEYNHQRQIFVPIKFDTNLPYAEITNRFKGGLTTDDEYELALLRYGRCTIHVPIQPIPILLVTEIMNPFYIFQIFSVIVWFIEDYDAYCYCIIFLSLLSTTVTLIETVSNL
jgi:cation-transporting ATPase 13A2